MNSYFSEIEKHIQELNSSNHNLFFKIIRLIAKELNIEFSNDSTAIDLFRNRSQSSNDRLLSYYFFRIIITEPDYLWQNLDLRIEVFKLFDNQLSFIYKTSGIEIREPNNKKLEVLEKFNRNLIGKLKFPIDGIPNEKQIDAFINHILFNLNNNSFAYFFNNLPSPELVNKENVLQIIKGLKDFLPFDKININDKLTNFQDFLIQFRKYISDLEKMNSPYLNVLLVQPLSLIHSNIIKDKRLEYLNNDTHLSIEYSKYRKYPLHLLKKQFFIRISILNKNNGIAFKTHLKIHTESKALKVINEDIYIGELYVGNKIEYNIEIRVIRKSEDVPKLDFILTWENNKGKRFSEMNSTKLQLQKRDIDWDLIKNLKPYNLTYVEDEKELFGREEILDKMLRKLLSPPLESCIITGQKRVGKTSIAKILEQKVKKHDPYFITSFCEVGKLNKNNSLKFINSLVEKVLEDFLNYPLITETNARLLSLDDTLLPILKFVESVIQKNNLFKFIIFIDEFDEIPLELYDFTPIGDTFFHNLRSIANIKNLSIVLIGGENMKLIHQSTDRINQFTSFPVTYFDKENYWKDFNSLVTKPIEELNIEYSPEAIEFIYKYSEGNPFYTKFICQEIYNQICSEKLSYIHDEETERAVNFTLSMLDLQNINHIWKDGIQPSQKYVSQRDVIESQRRKFLLDFAYTKRENNHVTEELLLKAPYSKKYDFDKMLKDFLSRGFVIRQEKEVRIKPYLIENYLVNKGFNKLSSELLNDDNITFLEDLETSLFVTDEEIFELEKKWGLYRGERITGQKIRAWLNQFENNSERRLAFKLLLHFRFYDENKIREMLKNLHDLVSRNIVTSIKWNKNRTLLLSAFGNINKSGSSLLRMYQSENSILSENIKSTSELFLTLKNKHEIRAICFIDDIIASGKTVIDNIKAVLNEEFIALLQERSIRIFIAAICGFEEGIQNIEKSLETYDKFNLIRENIEIKVFDLIRENEKAFHSEAGVFDSSNEISEAKSVMQKYGVKLVANNPLGKNNNQLLVAFSDNCPNNSLPIFWQETKNWIPLFKRNFS